MTLEERMQILKSIEAGQLSAEEGAKLLAALEEERELLNESTAKTKGRWLRVRITDRSTGKIKVNISIPLNLVNIGMKMGARFAPIMDDATMDNLRLAINEGRTGSLIKMEDEEEEELVEISVE